MEAQQAASEAQAVEEGWVRATAQYETERVALEQTRRVQEERDSKERLAERELERKRTLAAEAREAALRRELVTRACRNCMRPCCA